MPYVLLETLAHSIMPVHVFSSDDIHKLLSLKAAGLVDVDIPLWMRAHGDGEYEGPATVKAVTLDGLAALRKRSR